MSAARTPLIVLADDLPWWEAWRLATDASAGDGAGPRAWSTVLRQLIRAGHADPWVALADAAAYGGDLAWIRAAEAQGARDALRFDVATVIHGLSRAEADAAAGPLPSARALAREPDGVVAAWAAELRSRASGAKAPTRIEAEGIADWLLGEALALRGRVGGGPLGRAIAFAWERGSLVGIARPSVVALDGLTGLAEQIERLRVNTEAFLDARPAMHALLYGPRGSGKSTVVRGLLAAYAERGLRLVELPAASLGDLPQVVAAVRDRPERFLVFVDDLAFDAGDARYQALKSLLEGSVAERPDNVRIVATSNRRHLVQERHADRPDPLDDDVHAWDTHQERLALADRFGLLVTFPSADRRRYLAIVAHLAQREEVRDADLAARADRFARDGNGYSGRTARQFVDAVRSGLA
ncbi:MAG: DUF815 domain-containing protein [Trueperaceae bacterium]